MSTLKTTYIQHPSATDPAIELESDGTVLIPSLPVPPTPIPSFDSRTLITATNATWPVPTLANPVVKVTVVAGGGSGGPGLDGNGGQGGTSTFNAGSGKSFSATGGLGGRGGRSGTGRAGTDGFASMNGGGGASFDWGSGLGNGNEGKGGQVVTAYVDLTGVSTVDVTVGAGGTGGGSAGGRGEVLVEYAAG